MSIKEVKKNNDISQKPNTSLVENIKMVKSSDISVSLCMVWMFGCTMYVWIIQENVMLTIYEHYISIFFSHSPLRKRSVNIIL